MDIERLRRLPLFGELDHHDLSQLMRWVREVEVADGDLLFEQGSMPHDLFKLQRRWASVVAVGHVRAIALSADDLAEMSEQMPELADRLREMMTRRERENEI